MPVEITNVENLADDSVLGLQKISGIDVITIGGTSYALVTGQFDNKLSVFEIESDGSLNLVDSAGFSDGSGLFTASDVTSVSAGGKDYVLVSGPVFNAITVFELSPNGTLTQTDNFLDSGATALGGVTALATGKVGGKDFVFAAGYNEDGVSALELTSSGTLVHRATVFDDETTNLDQAVDLTTTNIGNKLFLFVAGEADDGISVFEVEPDGQMVNTDNVNDTGSLELNGASAVATATFHNGKTYVYAGGSLDAGLSVYEVGNSGDLTLAFNLRDALDTELRGIRDLTVAEVNGFQYLFVASYSDDNMSIWKLEDDGSVIYEVDAQDAGPLELGGVSAVGVAEIDGAWFAIAGGFTDDGVSVFEVEGPEAPPPPVDDGLIVGTNGKDLLVGNGTANVIKGKGGQDTLKGLNGKDELIGGGHKDRLIDGGGEDKLKGGAGADTFVFYVDNKQDRILDFEDDKDRIDLRKFSNIDGFSDLDIFQKSNGNIIISVGSEQIVLEDKRGDLNLEMLTGADFIFG